MRPCTHHRLFQSYLRLWLFAATAKGFQAFQAGLVGSKLKAKAPNCSAFHTLHNILYDLRTKLCNHGKNSNQAAGTVPWHVCGEHFTSSHELTAAHSCIDIILYVIYIYIYTYTHTQFQIHYTHIPVRIRPVSPGRAQLAPRAKVKGTALWQVSPSKAGHNAWG